MYRLLQPRRSAGPRRAVKVAGARSVSAQRPPLHASQPGRTERVHEVGVQHRQQVVQVAQLAADADLLGVKQVQLRPRIDRRSLGRDAAAVNPVVQA